MAARHVKRRTRTTVQLDAAAAVLVMAGMAGVAAGQLAKDGGLPVRPIGSVSPPRPRDALPAAAGAATVPRSVPARLSIPAIGVDTRLVRLGLNPDGTLQVPSAFSVAGWYELGPSPGQQGPAVIVGHVDSRRGPAVFYELGLARLGTEVRVSLDRGTDVLFRVYAVREYPKAAFPASLVYGPTPVPELRLVTCGGPFDHRSGHYLDNIVVFARFVRAVARIG